MTAGGRIAGLVLAAGASTRYGGGDKLLLPFDGGTVVGASVRAAFAARLDPVLVVLGFRARQVREALGHQAARYIENPRYAEGIGTSLATAAAELIHDPSVAAAVILLADEPGVSSAVVRVVIDEWRDTGSTAVRAVYLDRPGHPVLVDRSLFPLLLRCEGDRGLSAALRREGLPFHTVAIDDRAPVDIDTSEDYERAVRGRGA